jgi:hypothetical protein
VGFRIHVHRRLKNGAKFTNTLCLLRVLTLQYGFTKVRKGSDTDMYAHPSFVRDHPEALLKLQKMTTKNRRSSISNGPTGKEPRSVSPSFSHHPVEAALITLSPVVTAQKLHVTKKIVLPHSFDGWATNTYSKQRATPVSPPSQYPLVPPTDCDTSSTGSSDRGKLDLLAFALEQEIACNH